VRNDHLESLLIRQTGILQGYVGFFDTTRRSSTEDACAALRSALAWQRLLAKLRAKPWIVYAKAPLAGPCQVLNYLARYTYRIALSNERILDCRDGLVRFRSKDYARGAASVKLTMPQKSRLS